MNKDLKVIICFIFIVGLMMFQASSSQAATENLGTSITGVQTIVTGNDALANSSGTSLEYGTISNQTGGKLIISTGASLSADGHTITVNSDQNNYDYPGASIIFKTGSTYISSSNGKIDLIGNNSNVDMDYLHHDNFDDSTNANIIIEGELSNISGLFSELMADRGEVIFDPHISNVTYVGNLTLPTQAGGARITITSLSGTTLNFSGNIDLSAAPYASLLVGLDDNGQSGGVVTFDGTVKTAAMEVEVRSGSIVTFNDQVLASKEIFIDSNGAGGDVKFEDTVQTSLLGITGGRNIFMDIVTINSGSEPLAFAVLNPIKLNNSGFEDIPITTFKAVVNVTGNKDMTFYGGETHFEENINAGSSDLNIGNTGFSSTNDVLYDEYVTYTNSMGVPIETGLHYAMNNIKPKVYFDGQNLNLTASNMNIYNNGSVYINGSTTLSGNLHLEPKKMVSYVDYQNTPLQTTNELAGGYLNIGLNTFTVNGDAYFGSGSTLAISGDSSVNGTLVVNGILNVQDGAIIDITDLGNASFNSPIITYTSLSPASSGTFTSSSFIITHDLASKTFSASGFNGSQGISNYINQQAGTDVMIMTQSTNIVNTLTLVDNLYEDANNGLVSQDVVNRINNYIIAAGTTLAGNVELIEVALKQLAGEEALSSITASIDTARAFNTAISDRFTTLRTFNSTAPSAGAGDTLNRLWLSGFGNWSKLKDSAFTTGYKYTGGGVVLGYDRDVEAVPGLSVGLSGAWSKGKLKNNDGLSNTDINTGSFGLYSSYLFKNGFFIDALFSYGQSNNDTSTTQIIGNAIKEASYDTKSYLLGLNFGYDIPITDNIKLTPSAGVNYLSVHQDGWIESIVYDPLNLSLPPRFVSSSKNDIVEIPLNLKLSGNFTSDGGIDLNFGVRAGVVIEAEKPNNSLNTGFVGSSRSAVITGVSYGRSRFKGGASLGLQLSESVDVFFDYDIEARKQYTSHNATLGFGFSF